GYDFDFVQMLFKVRLKLFPRGAACELLWLRADFFRVDKRPFQMNSCYAVFADLNPIQHGFERIPACRYGCGTEPFHPVLTKCFADLARFSPHHIQTKSAVTVRIHKARNQIHGFADRLGCFDLLYLPTVVFPNVGVHAFTYPPGVFEIRPRSSSSVRCANISPAGSCSFSLRLSGISGSLERSARIAAWVSESSICGRAPTRLFTPSASKT